MFYIRLLEIVAGHFHLVLVEHITIGHLASGSLGPQQVVNTVNTLQIHGDALDAIGNFTRDGIAFQASGLLEIGELGDFHTVQPDLPA